MLPSVLNLYPLLEVLVSPVMGLVRVVAIRFSLLRQDDVVLCYALYPIVERRGISVLLPYDELALGTYWRVLVMLSGLRVANSTPLQVVHSMSGSQICGLVVFDEL